MNIVMVLDIEMVLTIEQRTFAAKWVSMDSSYWLVLIGVCVVMKKRLAN